MPKHKKLPDLKVLHDGEKFQLSNEGKFEFGMGWSAGGADLDASVIALDSSGKLIGTMYFAEKEALKDFGVSTSGDNTTGEGDGDDEVVTVDIAGLNKRKDGMLVHYLFFTISVFQSDCCNTFGCIGQKRINIYGPYHGDYGQIGSFDMNKSTGFGANHLVAGVMRRIEDTDSFEFVSLGKEISIHSYGNATDLPTSASFQEIVKGMNGPQIDEMSRL
jgi:stress response protein SCP2